MAPDYKIILFYKFVRIADPAGLRDEQRQICESFNLRGRMFIAHEGINATFEGTADDIAGYKKELAKNDLFTDVVFKQSPGTGTAFTKLFVRVRPEVVTLNAGEFDIQSQTAPAVSAQELDRMFEDHEDFVVLDLRNDYEIQAGKFDRTVNPNLQNFRDLPGKLPELAELKNKKVVTVCTGGIRCEKATCLLKREGFKNVFQLQDGIHTYLQKFPGKHFRGSLFVFDNRMVTPVVEVADREIVGECAFCKTKCEKFYNDDSVRPSAKIICCDDCIANYSFLRPAYVN